MNCDICDAYINGYPAILTSPASKNIYSVKQYHLCKSCFKKIIYKINI